MSELVSSVLIVFALAACGTQASDKIGVAECDAYEAKMAACASKVGGNVGDQLTKMRKMMLDAWKKDAANESMRAELAKTCSGAISDMKKQLPQCEW
jgi:uncharacterized protein (DUF885 family)